jgi:hypothetical protein
VVPTREPYNIDYLLHDLLHIVDQIPRSLAVTVTTMLPLAPHCAEQVAAKRAERELMKTLQVLYSAIAVVEYHLSGRGSSWLAC